MIITGENTIIGTLDLSSLERLGEKSSIESYPFHVTMKSGYSVEVEERFCALKSIQGALSLGYITLTMTWNDCDNIFIKSIPGYDPTKKQVLANINGVIGWKTAKDCNGSDA